MIGERLKWEDIVNQYPGKWVFLDDIEWEEEEKVNIVSAVLIEVTDDMHIDSVKAAFRAEGRRFLAERTTDDMNVGVIHCENFKLEVH